MGGRGGGAGGGGERRRERVVDEVKKMVFIHIFFILPLCPNIPGEGGGCPFSALSE